MIEAMACGTPVAAYPAPGPLDVVDIGKTGYLGEDLNYNISCCLTLDRKGVIIHSQKWSWEKAWEIFRDNMISTK